MDTYAYIDTNNLNFQRTYQKELRAEYCLGLMDRIDYDIEIISYKINKKIILSFSFSGSSRELKA